MHKLCIQIYAPFYRKMNIYGEREMGEFQTSISFMGTVLDGIVLLAEILKINTYQIPLVAPSKGERATENLLYYTTSIKVLHPPPSHDSLCRRVVYGILLLFFFAQDYYSCQLQYHQYQSNVLTFCFLPPSHPTPPYKSPILTKRGVYSNNYYSFPSTCTSCIIISIKRM